MSIFSDTLSLGLQTHEDLLADDSQTPPLLVWNSISFPCVPNVFGTRTQLLEGGFERDIDLIVFVRANSQPSGSTIQFGDTITADSTAITVDSTTHTVDRDLPLPSAGHLVTYKNRTYRVQSRREFHGFYRFELEDPHR
jgi:hypothetical protein